MEKEYITRSPEETERLGACLAEECKKDGPCFIALFGDLGAGKTAFVRGFASVLAPNAKAKSPTYTVVNSYRGEPLPVYHFDFYRIEDEDELYSIGFYDYLSSGVCIGEWSENIRYAIPAGSRTVTIEKDKNHPNIRYIRFGVYGGEA
ncbi:MAG: tRNA (adenosine(37)-N6)-threonylcarbamoyltransferase complex ATPase subunit type 1 TsaE [Clostridia bacterium]|nr:tRNA (adenosine(37)-N6)-threonylcarbamoyltransferase complex ATPase subunit type 1 TsaE [Clostridia bacterium]